MPAPHDQVLDSQFARLDEKVDGLQDAFEAWQRSSDKAIDAAFLAADKATSAALTAQKEAADKSEKAAQAQLEMHNGLIRKMDNLVSGFPSKESVAKDFENRDQRLNALDRNMARIFGAVAGIGGFASLLSAVAIFLAGKAT